MEGRKERLTYGWMDAWMDGLMDEGKERVRKESRKVTLKYGCIDAWLDER